MNERFGQQEDHLARELDRLENAISDENHAVEICSREEIWKIVYRLIDLAVAEERKRIENNIERYGFYDKYRNMNLEIAQNQSTINLITNK